VLALNSWKEALLHNRLLPHRDIITIRNHRAIHKVKSAGDLVEPEVYELFPGFIDFVAKQQAVRRSTDEVPCGWIKHCGENSFDPALLGSRWTLPFCYFGDQYAKCFTDTIGVDVGCNVAPPLARYRSDQFIAIAKKAKNYLWEFETFIPHFEYYKKYGCNIRGLDINPNFTSPGQAVAGDLRMLTADDEVIDFFTIAMIIGPGNPACTYLDVALCLGELKRTCNRKGLIYIADFIVMPALIACATIAGFRVFVNNSFKYNIPIGIFLIRSDADIERSSFQPIIEYLFNFELLMPRGIPLRITNRALLKTNCSPPKVEQVVNRRFIF
jgi:hypothetical protein